MELRALTRLAFDEIALSAGGIGQVHRAIANRAFLPGSAAKAVHDGIAGIAYASVAGVATVAGRAVPLALRDRPVPVPALAILNGLRGDVLEPPLAMPMTLRAEDGPPRLAVFVHGLFETEHAWGYGGGPTYAERLEGWTPVWVRYNTGRSIADNGRELAEQLDALAAAREVERIALVGHSMGGLVSCAAAAHGGAWAEHLTHVVSLGAPHTGAPLEAAVQHAAAELGLLPETRPFGSLLRRRSAGIRDLGRGVGCDLVDGVTYCSVAAVVHDVVGDWLVLERSATHRAQERLRVDGAHHLALLNHPAVLERLSGWLSPASRPARPARRRRARARAS